MSKATFFTFTVFVGSMKEKILSDVADIRFGINARTQSQKAVVCLQGKDFDEFGEIIHAGLLYVSEDQCKNTDILQPGDVLFAAKGSRNYAVLWRGEIPKAVASSTFFVVRNLNADVLPGYLAWFLMSAKAEQYFEQNVKVATVRTISKKSLERLEVPMDSASRQNSIIQLSKLCVKGEMLTLKIQQRYEYLIKHI